MTTPLQKAAQALIDNWDYPTISEYIAELRKALDAEMAQAPPPAFWLNECGQLSATRGWAERNSPGSKLTPLYMHPPQPQATTAVPAEVLEAIRRSGHALVKTQFGYRLIDAGTVAAQGEKP